MWMHKEVRRELLVRQHIGVVSRRLNKTYTVKVK